MAGSRKYRQNVWNILDPSDKQNHKQFNKTLGESSWCYITLDITLFSNSFSAEKYYEC